MGRGIDFDNPDLGVIILILAILTFVAWVASDALRSEPTEPSLPPPEYVVETLP